MADIILYHAVPSRSSIVHWMLEELGEPYDLHLLSLKEGEQKRPDFLSINPMGKVPAIRHKGVAVSESAAICTYLADEFPNARLNVPIGDPARGAYLRWMFFGPTCIEPAIMDRAYPRAGEAPKTALGYGEYDLVMKVLADAVGSGPWLMGNQFTAADVVVGSGLRWGTLFGLIPSRPEFDAYLERIEIRPAIRRSRETDQRIMAEQERKASSEVAD